MTSMRESIMANMLDISINGRLGTANLEFSLHFESTVEYTYGKKD